MQHPLDVNHVKWHCYSSTKGREKTADPQLTGTSNRRLHMLSYHLMKMILGFEDFHIPPVAK
jgi:hypothetical protein